MKVLIDKKFLRDANRITWDDRARFTCITDENRLDIQKWDWLEAGFGILCFDLIYSRKHHIWINTID